MFQNVISSKELIFEFLKRDLFANYKKSFIGSLWIVISPLVGIIMWVFFKNVGMLKPGEIGIPYPAYVLMGSLMWGLFMSFYTAASQTLTAGGSFILAVKYPHEVFLFEKALVQLVNFFIALLVNLGVLAFFKVFPTGGILLFPLVMLPLFFLGSAIGLLVALFSVIAIDTTLLMTAVMGLWMLITPVVYSDKIAHTALRTVIHWNPLTYLVCSARDIVIRGELYHPAGYFLSALGSFLFFMLVLRLFHLAEDKIVERML